MLTSSPFLGQVRLVPYAGYRPYMGAPARRLVLGDILSPENRNKYLAIISAGTQKLAQVRKWVSSARLEADQFVNTSAGNLVSPVNYLDQISRNQNYVDEVQSHLASSDPSMWDISDSYLGYIDDWAAWIDILVDAMRTSGGTPAGGGLPTGVKPPGPTGAYPGAQPVATPPKAGIKTNDLLLGGAVAVGLGVLIAALV